MKLQIGAMTLENDDLDTHVHGIGVSRSGKSKLIELACRQLVIKRIPFMLIDPHGSLYDALVEWMAFMGVTRSVTLIHPGGATAGYNPFKESNRDESRLATKCDRMVASVMRVWNEDPRLTPRLTKYLTCYFYLMLEAGLPVKRLRGLLDYKAEAGRAGLLRNLSNENVRAELGNLYGMSATQFEQHIESTANRLQAFFHPELLRLFSQPGIEIEQAVKSDTTILVNLQPSHCVSEENQRVVGTLLINDIWQSFRTFTKPAPYFLIVDECHKYLTPDVGEMLDEAAKRGLHLMLFHQRDAQLGFGFSSALQNARTKIKFSTEQEPREQRHYELRRSNMERTEFVAPEVKRYPVSPARLDAYKQDLLLPYQSAIVDEEELDEDDYDRK